jgi:acetyl-CoA C-acetyltransferase
MQAIVAAAQSILLGDQDLTIGAGAEVMSRAYVAPAVRWGQKMGNTTLLDSMLGALTDPFEGIHMGVTAENVAKRYGISREDQDALALESQQRAAHAISEGRFASQIVPVELRSRKGTTLFEVDEFVRRDAKLEDLAG